MGFLNPSVLLSYDDPYSVDKIRHLENSLKDPELVESLDIAKYLTPQKRIQSLKLASFVDSGQIDEAKEQLDEFWQEG